MCLSNPMLLSESAHGEIACIVEEMNGNEITEHI